MGVIDDVRKVIQDLVTPDLKALAVRMDGLEQRFEYLNEKIDVKLNALSAKIDSNHATVINALNIDKRLETLERIQSDQRREPASAAS